MMISLKKIDREKIRNKTVFLRLDINVPIDEDGKLLDPARILKALPTINLLQDLNCKIILASHFGRPKGKIVKELSLKKVIPFLESYLGQKILFIEDIRNPSLKKDLGNTKSIVLLENLRFFPEEEANDPIFSQHLASLADVYINEAFSCSHRAHASVLGITEFLDAYPGITFEKEITEFNKISSLTLHPRVLIIGGKKISSKLPVLINLSPKFDQIIIAGAMANNFLKMLGNKIGSSYYEDIEDSSLNRLYHEHKDKILIPSDFVGHNENEVFLKKLGEISENDNILDIGIETCQRICDLIANAKFLLWNGPLGMYEKTEYAVSSLYVGRYIAARTKEQKLYSIVGGGDAAAIINASKLTQYYNHVSTGGGAFLELLEKNDIVGLKNLK